MDRSGVLITIDSSRAADSLADAPQEKRKHMSRKFLSFLLGIVNPEWMPQAPVGESVGESVRLSWQVHT